jgi:hypothetical protein
MEIVPRLTFVHDHYDEAVRVAAMRQAIRAQAAQ